MSLEAKWAECLILCLLYTLKEQTYVFSPHQAEIALQDIERHRFVLNAACAESLPTAASNCEDMRREHIQLLQDSELGE